jgi:hypothetical protein
MKRSSESSAFIRKPVGLLKTGWMRLFTLGLFLLPILFPVSLKAATWHVDTHNGIAFSTLDSLNSADVGTSHITIDPGDTIEWTINGSDAPHSVSSGGNGPCTESFDFGGDNGVPGGTVVTQVFTAAGTCNYFCKVHGASSMSGTITIGGGGGGPGPEPGGPAVVDSTALGFFDGDANPDVVVASGATKKLQLFPMNGTGGFLGGNPPTPTFSMNLAETPMGIAAGDFNNNTDPAGNDDIVILDQRADGSTSLSVYYGNGAGSFPTSADQQRVVPKQDNSLEVITSVEARDLNGDGKTDLIVTLLRTDTGGATIDPEPRVLFGNGDGTFQGDAPLISSVTVTPGATSLGNGTGQHQQFVATALNFNGDPVAVTFVWSSTNSAICSVDQNGLATEGAGGTGTSVIEAKVAGVSDTSNCNVVTPSHDVTAQALSAAVAGTNVLATNTVSNAGNVKEDTVAVNLYLSPDNVITGSGNDILVGNRTIIDLQAGAISSVTTTISIPGTGVSTGNYFVGMKVDPANAIIETNETNNTRATTGSFAIGPDLRVFSIQGTLAGTNIIVSDTEQNVGNNDAGPFNVSFYFSPIANPNPATDTLIGSRSIAGLGGGSAVNSGSTNFPVPASTPTGTYFLCAITDSDNTVAETNETQASNEKCTSAASFVIGPDLVVLSLSVTQVGGAGGTTFTITDTEQNVGEVAAGAFDVKFYLSLNATFGAGDIQLAPGSRSVSGLAGGSATSTGTGSHTVPSGTPAGNYFIIAVSDANAVVPETNEANNTRATSGTYSVPAVP